MEVEYKWNLPSDVTLERMRSVLPLSHPEHIHMHATYYDTDDQQVYRMHGGLRMRSENELSICCLKLDVSEPGECKKRQEFEAEAPSIIAGLEALPNVGAPRDICMQLIAGDPQIICETDFMRDAYAIQGSGFEAELAIDTGELRREERTAPIAELEFELKAGDEEAFNRFADELESTYALTAQPLSKLARAMRLWA